METNTRRATRVESVFISLESEKLKRREARLLLEILSDIHTCIDFFFLNERGFIRRWVRGQGRRRNRDEQLSYSNSSSFPAGGLGIKVDFCGSKRSSSCLLPASCWAAGCPLWKQWPIREKLQALAGHLFALLGGEGSSKKPAP